MRARRLQLWSELAACIGALLLGAATQAGKPIWSRFAADPSPHAFAGQIHLYATDDASNSGKYSASTSWRLYTSPDMNSWRDRGAVLDVTAFRWAPPDAKAWAPEAAFRHGCYYSYARLVATGSASPWRAGRTVPFATRSASRSWTRRVTRAPATSRSTPRSSSIVTEGRSCSAPLSYRRDGSIAEVVTGEK